MKVHTIISSDILKKDSIIKDKIYLISFSIIAVSFIFGTALYITAENSLTEEIFSCFTEFYSDFSHKTKLEVFSGILLSHLPYIMLVIILGTSAYGYGIIWIFSFIKASGLGILAAYFYTTFALEGIEYALLVFFPGKFFLILSMLFTMKCSADNSLYISRLIKGECRTENSSTLYSLKMVTAVLLFVLSSAIDCFTVVSFSSLFSF